MGKKRFVIAAVLGVTLLLSGAGCAKKNVRHLASDVCLISPEKTSKEQVLIYLGQPDEQHENVDGSETWLYYDVQKTALSDTPYIGDKLGEKKYEMVKVTIQRGIVQTCIYRSLSEEEYEEGGLNQ